MSEELHVAQRNHRVPVTELAIGRITAALLVAVAAVVTRFWSLGGRSLWLDEAWGWRATTLPLSDVLNWAGDGNPPLYYVLLRAWAHVAGDSEVALRSPSAFAAALTLALLAYVGWRSGGILLGVCAAGVLLANGADIWFAQEARMYPLVGLLSIASSLMLAAALDRPSMPRLVVYLVTMIALVYTHYSGFLVLGVHVALIAVYGLRNLLARRDARVLAGGAIVVIMIFLAYVPLLPHLRSKAESGAGYIPPPSATLVQDVARAALGLDAAGQLWLLFAVPLAAFGARAVIRRRHDTRIVCISALAFVPLAQLMVSVLRTPVFDLRQVSPYIPALTFIAALAIVEIVRTLTESRETVRLLGTVVGAAAFALLALTMARGMLDAYSAPSIEDWRHAAVDASPGDGPIFIWRRYASTPLSYYQLSGARVREIPAPNDEGVGRSVALNAPGSAPAAATLILSHGTDLESKQIRAALSKYYRLGKPSVYPGIIIYRLEPL